jgi:hypothetical protein
MNRTAARQRGIEKSKEEFLARLVLESATALRRLTMLAAFTPGASLRQVVNRALMAETGKPIQRYKICSGGGR